MKIIAKPGTALEQTIKAMHDKIKKSFDEANDMVEQITGSRPVSPAGIYHWGTIMKFVPEFTFKPEDEDKIDKKVLRPMPKVRNGWKPNLRTKEGKDFRSAFNAKAEEWEVTEDALHEFGIHMTDFNRGVSHYIRPMYDSERNRYFLLCSDSIPRAFDKKRLAKDQFDIEYE